MTTNKDLPKTPGQIQMAPAIAARMRNAENKKAAVLTGRGWTCIAPDQLTEDQLAAVNAILIAGRARQAAEGLTAAQTEAAAAIRAANAARVAVGDAAVEVQDAMRSSALDRLARGLVRRDPEPPYLEREENGFVVREYARPESELR